MGRIPGQRRSIAAHLKGFGHGAPYETENSPFILKTDLGLGRVHVHVDLIGGKPQEQDGLGVFLAQYPAAVGFPDGADHGSVLDRSAIDVHENAIAAGLGRRRVANEAADGERAVRHVHEVCCVHHNGLSVYALDAETLDEAEAEGAALAEALGASFGFGKATVGTVKVAADLGNNWYVLEVEDMTIEN